MNVDQKLVYMANQIATFFRSYPEAEAVAGIHKHIVAFWTPKMIAHLEAALPEQSDRVDSYVRRALHGAEPAADVAGGAGRTWSKLQRQRGQCWWAKASTSAGSSERVSASVLSSTKCSSDWAYSL